MYKKIIMQSYQKKQIRIHTSSQFDESRTAVGHGTNINGPFKVKGFGTFICGKKYCAIGEIFKVNNLNQIIAYPSL